jgi:hypothetical protein
MFQLLAAEGCNGDELRGQPADQRPFSRMLFLQSPHKGTHPQASWNFDGKGAFFIQTIGVQYRALLSSCRVPQVTDGGGVMVDIIPAPEPVLAASPVTDYEHLLQTEVAA